MDLSNFSQSYSQVEIEWRDSDKLEGGLCLEEGAGWSQNPSEFWVFKVQEKICFLLLTLIEI